MKFNYISEVPSLPSCYLGNALLDLEEPTNRLHKTHRRMGISVTGMMAVKIYVAAFPPPTVRNSLVPVTLSSSQ